MVDGRSWLRHVSGERRSKGPRGKETEEQKPGDPFGPAQGWFWDTLGDGRIKTGCAAEGRLALTKFILKRRETFPAVGGSGLHSSILLARRSFLGPLYPLTI